MGHLCHIRHGHHVWTPVLIACEIFPLLHGCKLNLHLVIKPTSNQNMYEANIKPHYYNITKFYKFQSIDLTFLSRFFEDKQQNNISIDNVATLPYAKKEALLMYITQPTCQFFNPLLGIMPSHISTIAEKS